MLLEICIGDAWGACFEYAAPTPDRPNDLRAYTPNPQHTIGGGLYTDDGQMSVGLAEAMIEGPLTRGSVAAWWVHCYRRDPRQGYSRAMQQFIASCRDGAELLARVNPASDKSGACMRACPAGLYGSIPEVLAAAELQARVTHDTPGGVASAQAVALMAHAMRYRLCGREDLPAFLAGYVPGPWEEPWSGPVGAPGMESARAALWAVVRHASMADMLRACVDYTGDVDTVAAVAMGVASVARDTVADLPASLYDGFEQGRYGRPYLEALDARLEAFARSCGAPPLTSAPAPGR